MLAEEVQQASQIIDLQRQENDHLHSIVESQRQRIDEQAERISLLQRQTEILEETTDTALDQLRQEQGLRESLDEKTKELEEQLKRLQRRQDLTAATIANPHLSIGHKVTTIALADEMERQEAAGEEGTELGIFEFPDARLADLTGLSRQHAGGNINALAEAGIALVQKLPAKRAPADGRRKTPGQPVKYVSLSSGGWEGFMERAATYSPQAPADELAESIDAETETVGSLSPRQLRLRRKQGMSCADHGSKLIPCYWCEDGQHIVFPSVRQGDTRDRYQTPGIERHRHLAPGVGPSGGLQRLPGAHDTAGISG